MMMANTRSPVPGLSGSMEPKDYRYNIARWGA
jgi:hypothetical protein